MEKKCIQEVTRQLCHPKDGLPNNKDLKNPKTLLDWIKCLEGIDGWVNLGISSNMAKIFLHLKIGEVIPSCSSNLDFYTFGFATTEIQRFLCYRKHDDKTHILILNYYSFCRLIELILQNKTKNYHTSFHKNIRTIFKKCSEKNFWIHIPISEDTKYIMEKNRIGEIIINNEYTLDHIRNTNKDYTEYYKKDDDINDDIDDDMNNLNTHMKETSISNIIEDEGSENIEEDLDTHMEKSKNEPYRILMNNKSLLYFLEKSCKINNIKPNENIFHNVGAYDDSLEDLFGSLSI